MVHFHFRSHLLVPKTNMIITTYVDLLIFLYKYVVDEFNVFCHCYVKKLEHLKNY